MKEKELILKIIANKNGSINFRQLQKKSNIDNIQLQNILLELKLDAKVLQTADKYCLFPNDLLIGEISQTISGSKVIFYEGEKIQIASNLLNGAIPNDIVAFKMNNNEAEIVSIVNRRSNKITCEVVVENGIKKIIPYHSGLQISLSIEDKKELLDGDIILVDISDYDNEFCNAKLIKKIDIVNSPNKSEIETAINYGLYNDFNDAYIQELDKLERTITNEEIEKRIDYRTKTTFTIDPLTAKDMDDALSVSKIDNEQIRVYVHIADISHFIKTNSEIFKRARSQCVSVYMNNTVLPLFHHNISNGICSLNQGEDKLAKTVIMDIDKLGNITNIDIQKTIIRSDKKMNYDDVDKILLNNEIIDGYQDFVEDIKLLYEASTRIQEKMLRNGKLIFNNNEKHIDNMTGKMTSVDNNSPSRDLVEYLMIEANHQVALYLQASGLNAIYRIHEFPDLLKINEAIKCFNELGKRIKPLKELNSSIDIQKIQKKIINDEDYEILSGIILRHMQRARYSTEEIEHFALALEIYTHFTAPIRRITDLAIHMIIDFLLEDKEYIEIINQREMKIKLENLCKDASFMSRQAELAEKEAEKNKIIESMVNFIGEEFVGYVIDTEHQIKIRINSIDVVINSEDLSSDFKWNKKHKSFYDKSNNAYLKPGRKVKVVLRNVNLHSRTLKLDVLNIIDAKVLTKTLN